MCGKRESIKMRARHEEREQRGEKKNPCRKTTNFVQKQKLHKNEPIKKLHISIDDVI